ncbi:hypothetical protein RHGRI_031886 [Rhododendron griersonianum]|uniref:Aminotransferase class V domain-containing protein n=1 Tax=Rhododendron griersonianum TaxID=479676 RepID=A0AAV6IE99_9ERIC|nr:hypothetical protein RHGRI_031886 [Rhododendron griersonianum]
MAWSMVHLGPRGMHLHSPWILCICILNPMLCFANLVIQVELSNYLYESLRSVPNIRIYGPVPSQTVRRAALCSFNVKDIHPTDIATFLDQQHGVAIRSGHHCAQPLHRHLGVNASARASFYFYNTKEDVDNFVLALNDTVNFFSSFR